MLSEHVCLQAWVKYLNTGQRSTTRLISCSTLTLSDACFKVTEPILDSLFHLHHTASYMYVYLHTNTNPHNSKIILFVKAMFYFYDLQNTKLLKCKDFNMYSQ